MTAKMILLLGFICLLLVSTATAAETAANETEATAQVGTDGVKQLSGMSIVGNDEAPKSLTIVPWKSSEIGAETSLKMALNKENHPVDRDVFKRRLNFYQVSVTQENGR